MWICMHIFAYVYSLQAEKNHSIKQRIYEYIIIQWEICKAFRDNKASYLMTVLIYSLLTIVFHLP